MRRRKVEGGNGIPWRSIRDELDGVRLWRQPGGFDAYLVVVWSAAACYQRAEGNSLTDRKGHSATTARPTEVIE